MERNMGCKASRMDVKEVDVRSWHSLEVLIAIALIKGKGRNFFKSGSQTF